jgi:hypothetical protein
MIDFKQLRESLSPLSTRLSWSVVMRSSLSKNKPTTKIHPPACGRGERSEGRAILRSRHYAPAQAGILLQPRALSHKNGRGEIRQRLARGVTVIEVLFAMVVMLVGLVGMVALLPMAGRQASDSYSLTHGSATMQNAKAAFVSMGTFEPTPQRPWWFADDEYATAPTTNLGFQFPYYSESRWYRSASDKRDVLTFVKQRKLPVLPNPPYSPAQANDVGIKLELARRNGRAQGFCIDPIFCATEISENWSNTGYTGSYQHDRGGSQGVFRRSRMPFFDEQTELGTSGFTLNTSRDFPKLMRVSFQGNTTSIRFNAPPEPLPMNRDASQIFSMPGGDLTGLDPEDKSLGPLRYFDLTSGQGFVNSPSNQRVSWLATLTPSEITSPDTDPASYNLAVAVFSNRDQFFGAGPLAMTGSDEFAEGEKMCFATSPSSTSVAITQLGDLPFSPTGGAFEVQLWSDTLTNSKVRSGEWVMLSRRIVLGNEFTWSGTRIPEDVNRVKVIHRHRWYRVIGVIPPPPTQTTSWPITVRLQGEPWDYPEMNSVMS